MKFFDNYADACICCGNLKEESPVCTRCGAHLWIVSWKDRFVWALRIWCHALKFYRKLRYRLVVSW